MLFSYLFFGLRGYSVNICLEHALRLKMIYNMLDLCVTLIKIEPYYIINGAVIKLKVPYILFGTIYPNHKSSSK